MSIAGQSFVFTGKMASMTRGEAQEMVARSGGHITSGLNKASYLVVGDLGSEKYGAENKQARVEKRREEGLEAPRVLTEKQFLRLMSQQPPIEVEQPKPRKGQRADMLADKAIREGVGAALREAREEGDAEAVARYEKILAGVQAGEVPKPEARKPRGKSRGWREMTPAEVREQEEVLARSGQPLDIARGWRAMTPAEVTEQDEYLARHGQPMELGTSRKPATRKPQRPTPAPAVRDDSEDAAWLDQKRREARIEAEVEAARALPGFTHEKFSLPAGDVWVRWRTQPGDEAIMVRKIQALLARYPEDTSLASVEKALAAKGAEFAPWLDGEPGHSELWAAGSRKASPALDPIEAFGFPLALGGAGWYAASHLNALTPWRPLGRRVPPSLFGAVVSGVFGVAFRRSPKHRVAARAALGLGAGLVLGTITSAKARGGILEGSST